MDSNGNIKERKHVYTLRSNLFGLVHAEKGFSTSFCAHWKPPARCEPPPNDLPVRPTAKVLHHRRSLLCPCQHRTQSNAAPHLHSPLHMPHARELLPRLSPHGISALKNNIREQHGTRMRLDPAAKHVFQGQFKNRSSRTSSGGFWMIRVLFQRLVQRVELLTLMLNSMPGPSQHLQLARHVPGVSGKHHNGG